LNTPASEGKRLIDLGCMQINHRYHGAEFSSVMPCSIPMPMSIMPPAFLPDFMHGMKPGPWQWRAITQDLTMIRRKNATSAG
jgi:hypothetical protein